MKQKKKLLFSFLIIAFIAVSIVATVAIAFALTQQQVRTTLNVNYKAIDVNGSVRAFYTMGSDTTEYDLVNTDPTAEDQYVVEFDGSSESGGALQFAEGSVDMTSSASYVTIKYEFTNKGGNPFTAIVYQDIPDENKNNMKITYSLNGEDWMENLSYGLVVKGNNGETDGFGEYYIKVEVEDLSQNASLTGSLEWVLENYEGDEDIIELQSATTGIPDDGDGTAVTSYSGVGETYYVPSKFGSVDVTKISANSTLSAAQKQTVTKIVIPAGIEEIGDGAFSGYSNLEEVQILQNNVSGASAQSTSGVLTRIGGSAFNGCSKLKSLTIPNTVTTIDGYYAFAWSGLETFRIQDGSQLTNFGNGQHFRSCTNLNSVYIGEGVKKLGTHFLFNSGVKELRLPSTLESMEFGALASATRLEELTIPAKALTLATDSIRACTALKKVTINSTSIANFGTLFVDTPSIEEVVLNTENIIKSNSIKNLLLNKNVKVTFGPAVKTIASDAFTGLNLNSIVVDMETVPANLFENNYSIANVEFTSNVKTISSHAFAGCAGLSSVTLANTITTIESDAFENIFADFYIENSFKPTGWAADFAENADSINYGSNQAHTHTYKSTTSYYVEDGKAYSYNKCSICGYKGNVAEAANAVVATTATAQSILDTNIDGKTVVLSQGVYDNEIDIRSSLETAKVYKGDSTNNDAYILGDEVTGTTLDATFLYHYIRKISNAKIVGADGAVLTYGLRVFSGYFTGAFYDAVRQQNLPGSSWDDSVSLENVSFENLRFAGKYGRMDIGGATQHSTFTNVTINNCSAISDEVSTDWIYDANRVDDGGANTQNGAFRLAFGKATLNGLTFTNNCVDFHYQGMYISKTGGNTMTNITASNNRISNTKHNAIGIHNFTGNLTVNNNIVKNCLDAVSPEETDPDVWTEGGERALRFSKGTNATVVISGNRISNAYKQVIFYGSSTDILSGTYSITDNYYNGLKLADATGTDVSFNITHD